MEWGVVCVLANLLQFFYFQKVELVFLIDASSSVGFDNFQSELKFVKKLLADFTVSFNQTRVAIVTFSSIGQVVSTFQLILCCFCIFHGLLS